MALGRIQIAGGNAPIQRKIVSGSVLEYEQHSKPYLAIAIEERGGKWRVVNQDGAELSLPASRLYLYPDAAREPLEKESRVAFLQDLVEQEKKFRESISLAEIWELLEGEVRETSIEQIVDIVSHKNKLLTTIAVRRSLLNDAIFFKRKKTGFEPREAHIVEELQKKAAAEERKRKKREMFIEEVLTRLADSSAPLPAGISALKEYAALGKNASDAKETRELLEEIIRRGNCPYSGKAEAKAFALLVDLKYFSPDENLVPIRLGRPLVFSPRLLTEAKTLASSLEISFLEKRLNLESLDCITIDGVESNDFDDALSLEELEHGYRIGIHISDVASQIEVHSPLEEQAFRRATSIYMPDAQLPMFPEDLSDGLLSLIRGSRRPTISFLLETDTNYEITSRKVCLSTINVSHRLSYEETDERLYSEDSSDSLGQMLLHLWNAASVSETNRIDQGALQFSRREMMPRILEENRVTLEESDEDAPSRKLVSELMILANETAALFAKDKGLPLVFRSQEPPEVDIDSLTAQVPEGPAQEYAKRGTLKRSSMQTTPAMHSSLGLKAYAQVTSPIRRAYDLVNQRQLFSFLTSDAMHYSEQEIQEIIAALEIGSSEALSISRARNRYWLLKYLVQENITEIKGTIVRVDGPKPLAELDIIYSLFPFHPQSALPDNPQQARGHLGRKVVLKVTNINPQSDSLVLHEVG